MKSLSISFLPMCLGVLYVQYVWSIGNHSNRILPWFLSLYMLQLLTTQYAFSLNFIIIFLSFPSSHDFSHKTQCLPNFLKSLFFSYTAQAQIDSIYRFNLFVMDGGDRPIKIGGGILPKAPSFQPCFFPSIETSSFMFSMLQFWFIERYPFVYEDVFDKSF